MNGEGIMSLPAGPMGPTPVEDPAAESTLAALRSSISPTEFSQELTYSMAEVDPAAVEELLRELDAIDLPPNAWQALEDLVQYLLENPEDYAEVRQDVVSGGLPEEFLPETFDVSYLTMLKVALDQMTPDSAPGMGMQSPVMMAQGGLASLPAMNPIAQSLAGMGRNGDTMLAHITPEEARMLQQRGGSGTINPYTGLPEFFLKKAWKAVTGAVKGVVKGVTKAVKGVVNAVKKVLKSPIGKIAATIAAVYFLGPKGLNLAAGKLGISNAAVAMGVNSFVGSTAVNLASGMKPKDALQQGLVTGVLAGVGTGLTTEGGFGATAPGYSPPPTPGVGTAIEGFGAASDQVYQGADFASRTPSISSVSDLTSQARTEALLPATSPVRTSLLAGGDPFADALQSASAPATAPLASPYALTATGYPEAAISSAQGGLGVPGVSPTSYSLTGGPPTSAGIGSLPTGTIPVPPVSTAGAGVSQAPAAAADRGFFGKIYDYFSPSAREAAGEQAALAKYNEVLASTGNKALAEKAYTAALPGIIGKYGPLAAAGLGATAFMGGFKGTPAEEEPLGFDPITGLRPGELPFDQQRPDLFGPDRRLSSPTFTLADTLVQSPRYSTPAPSGVPVYQAPNMMTFMPGGIQQPYNRSGLYGIPNIYTAKKGSGPEGVTEFPRKTGAINGPGTGTSDSIPAMLSDGEFVFTAKAVRNMGNGSRRKGAARMYKLMKMLEGGAVKKG